ncbi:MAG: hypothetical protein CMH04_00855 [Marinovum sp.]|nr:hypothetical protein [Marinovum sp.]|tara:strand:+ start:3164 stop:3685 length:522 start_codon:yes stop_codon:yes gene_type:complete
MSTLKVGAITSLTGNNAATIANDGKLTTVAPLSVTTPILVQAAMNLTMATTGIIVWNEKQIDTTSSYSTSTGRFTCPRAGYYEVSFNYLLRNCTSGHRTNVRKNGINQGHASPNSSKSIVWTYVNTGEVNIAASLIVNCAQNDLLDVHLTYLANGDIYGGGNVHNSLNIKFLG